MIIKPFYTLIDHREFEYLKEKIKEVNEILSRGDSNLACSYDPFYNLDAIKITKSSNNTSECYLTEWGVGYIIDENDQKINLRKKILDTIVKEIKTPDENLHENFKKWLDKKEEDTELESSLHGISFPLLRKEDINGEYGINFDNNSRLDILNYFDCNDEKWEAALSPNKINYEPISTLITNTPEPKELLKKLCIQHHLYTTLKSVALHHVKNTKANWDDIKRYVDVRTAQYREGISILRGMLNEFSLFNELFAKLWDMDVPDKPKIKKFTRMDNHLKLTKKFNRKKIHTEIYQHANIAGEIHAEIDDFVTDNINLRLTDDMRSAQLALRILQPLFVIGVVLTFMTIVFRIMGTNIFDISIPQIFVVGTSLMVIKILIITLAMIVSMFWITLNIITYVRAFEQTIGATRLRSDITKDMFFYIGSMGMIFIVISLLINGLESTPLIETLSIVMVSIIVMLFVVLLILAIKLESARVGVKDTRKKVISEWAGIGASMFLSLLSVGFLYNNGAVGELPVAYLSLLWFVVFISWLFFLIYANKMGHFIFVVDEIKPWEEFKNEIRKKFAGKIKDYIDQKDNKDPYKGWNYGKIFIKFKDDFLEKYIKRDTSLVLVYSVIMMQTLAVTFNIGFILDEHNLSLLFISAIASILTTFIKLDQYVKLKEDDEEDKGKIYFSIAFIASIIADIHFIPAIIFYSAGFSLDLAVGAFIANVVALAAILIESVTIKDKVKEIKFKI